MADGSAGAVRSSSFFICSDARLIAFCCRSILLGNFGSGVAFIVWPVSSFGREHAPPERSAAVTNVIAIFFMGLFLVVDSAWPFSAIAFTSFYN